MADLAKHMILILSFLVQNGYCMYNDNHNETIWNGSYYNDSYIDANLIGQVGFEIGSSTKYEYDDD